MSQESRTSPGCRSPRVSGSCILAMSRWVWVRMVSRPRIPCFLNLQLLVSLDSLSRGSQGSRGVSSPGYPGFSSPGVSSIWYVGATPWESVALPQRKIQKIFCPAQGSGISDLTSDQSLTFSAKGVGVGVRGILINPSPHAPCR